MKKIFVTLLAVASVFTSVTAQVQRKTEGRKEGQERSKGEGREHGRFDRGEHHGEALKQLNLSDDQKTRLKSINQDFKNKMQELGKNDGLTVKEARERRAALVQEHKTQIEQVLTAEQKAKLEQFKTEAKDKRGEGFGGKGHEGSFGKAPDFDKLKTELNLTDDQLTKLKIRRSQVEASMKSIRDDQSLTQEQKKEKMMQLRKDSREVFENLLTPEQKQKMEDLKKNHQGKEGRKHGKKQAAI